MNSVRSRANTLIKEAAEGVNKWLDTLPAEEVALYFKWREERDQEIALQFFADTGVLDDDAGTQIGIGYIIDKQTLDSLQGNFPDFYKLKL